MVQTIETDYLIIGAGALGMAFADEIVTRSRNARLTLVDRRATPGGHWNDAYRFVTLHQPALYYGVNSERLESGEEDLASRSLILAYYERILEKLCATGRVTFYGQCDYEGDGRFRSMVANDRVYQATVHRKTVDATYMNVTVPATRPPRYGVAEGVTVVPINALAELKRPWARYVVIGAGKTGLDALLFLLDQGVEPDRISWIVSQDAWLFNRATLLPSVAPRFVPLQLPIMAKATDADAFFRSMESVGVLFRLDETIWPGRFRCATVSPEELDRLRCIRDVVRLGRVVRIDPTEIVLDRGVVTTGEDVLHVDCTADGLVRRPSRPIFEGDRITLQPVAMCQPAFGAAVVAFVETRYDDDTLKNALCKPVPHPVVPEDFFRAIVDTVGNTERWMVRFGWWLFRSRLSILHHFSLLGVLRILLSLVRWYKGVAANLGRIQQSLEESQTGSPTPGRGFD